MKSVYILQNLAEKLNSSNCRKEKMRRPLLLLACACISSAGALVTEENTLWNEAESFGFTVGRLRLLIRLFPLFRPPISRPTASLEQLVEEHKQLESRHRTEQQQQLASRLLILTQHSELLALLYEMLPLFEEPADVLNRKRDEREAVRELAAFRATLMPLHRLYKHQMRLAELLYLADRHSIDKHVQSAIELYHFMYKTWDRIREDFRYHEARSAMTT